MKTQKYGLLGCFVLLAISFTGCSKKDTTIAGTGVGAAVGAEVAGKNNKILGAAAGALAGHWFGRKIGEAIEEDKAENKQELRAKHRIRKLKEENRQLRKHVENKWCPCCYRKVKIANANTCPFCGHDLIIEKYCARCSRAFEPDTAYKYCPSCVGGIKLSCR